MFSRSKGMMYVFAARMFNSIYVHSENIDIDIAIHLTSNIQLNQTLLLLHE